MRMLRAGLVALSLALSSTLAVAQQNNLYWLNYNGAAPFPPSAWTPVSPTNPLPVSGSFSATLAGYAPNGNNATLSVSSVSANVGLPVGASINVYNTGANVVFTKLGTSNAVTVTATTGDQIPAGGCMSFAVGSNTFIAAITATSTSTIVVTAGTGLGTCGGGGGGGGGSGGTVTQGNAGTNAQAWWMRIGDATNGPVTVGTYGTAPGAVAALNVNASVTNANANGQATMAASSPVVIASDQRVSNLWTTVPINISTATTTQLVALSGSTKIYAYVDVLAGGTGNITFEYGTGANCGTGTTALTGPYNLTAQAGTNPPHLIVVPAGNALCALTTAAVQISGSVTFQQF